MNRIAGIVGWPVTHSLSPRLHAYWLKELRVEGSYIPLPVVCEDFSVVVEGLRRAGFAGVNVTAPHKQAAFALARAIDESAQATCAANLLLFEAEGRIEARNTDATGLRTNLEETLGMNALKDREAILLGAGGSARAAVAALSELGTAKIWVWNRTGRHAQTMIAELRPRLSASLTLLERNEWTRAAASAALLVNATYAGMAGAAPLDLPLDPLPPSAAVCDLVYNPLQTPLLRAARARGLKTIDGLGMLMHQAVPAFAAFYGVMPSITPELRRDLERALAQ